METKRDFYFSHDELMKRAARAKESGTDFFRFFINGTEYTEEVPFGGRPVGQFCDYAKVGNGLVNPSFNNLDALKSVEKDDPSNLLLRQPH